MDPYKKIAVTEALEATEAILDRTIDIIDGYAFKNPMLVAALAQIAQAELTRESHLVGAELLGDKVVEAARLIEHEISRTDFYDPS
jgi:ABC-type sugar transport system substrate-binding protein